MNSHKYQGPSPDIRTNCCRRSWHERGGHFVPAAGFRRSLSSATIGTTDRGRRRSSISRPYPQHPILSENINCLYLFTYQQSTTCVVACELIQHKEQSLKFQIPELKQGRWKKPGWVNYPFADSSFLLCFACGIALTCSDVIICFSGEAVSFGGCNNCKILHAFFHLPLLTTCDHFGPL